MRLKPFVFFGFVLLAMSNLASGQVVPAALQGSTPIQVSVGMSYWYPNWGGTKAPMIGITGAADFHPPMPRMLTGLGLEAEYRVVNMHRTYQPANYKEQTIGGGPIYSFPFRQNLRFYGKGLIEYGSMDFTFASAPTYTHDSRIVIAPGGGAQYRIHSGFWVRGDYEYQIWQPMFSATKRPTPSGFTFGVGYDLRGFHRGR